MSYSFPSPWRALLDAGAQTRLDLAVAAAEREMSRGRQIFPERANWFAALEHTPPENVRAVILGQDPYPTPGNAMGLAFSVPRGVKVPASLRNIYKALQIDLGIAPPLHGDLSAWAEQGVLLLNTALTVEEGKPGSHASFGWGEFTDGVIASLGAADATPKAFMLWGAHAQKKAPLIDATRHALLEAVHPSPLSAHRGFFECRHFSKANAFLGVKAIDWSAICK